MRGSQKMQEYGAALNVEEIKALGAASIAQTQITGIKWVDTINMTVRPFVTYYFLLVFGVYKAACFSLAIKAGAEWEKVATAMWTRDDATMLASILTFWFVDRSLRRMRG